MTPLSPLCASPFSLPPLPLLSSSPTRRRGRWRGRRCAKSSLSKRLVHRSWSTWSCWRWAQSRLQHFESRFMRKWTLTGAVCLRAGVVQHQWALREAEDFCLCVVRTDAFVHQPDPEGPRPGAAQHRGGFLQVAAQEGETSLKEENMWLF